MVTQFLLFFVLIALGWNRDSFWHYKRRTEEDQFVSYEFSDMVMSLVATVVVSVLGILLLMNTAPPIVLALLNYNVSGLRSLFGLGLLIGVAYWFGKWLVFFLFCQVRPDKRPVFWLIRFIVFLFHQVAGPVAVALLLRFVIEPQQEVLSIVIVFGTLAHFIVDLLMHLVGVKKVHWSAEGISGIFLIVTQTLAYVVVRIIFLGSFLFRIKYTNGSELSNLSRGDTIVVANHRRWWDIFCACMALPPHVFLRLVPLRFMTKDMYVMHLWQKIFMVTFGAFAAKQEYNKTGLEMAIRLMRKKHTILLFPEGRIIKKGITPKARVGVAYLAQETGAQILPVYMGANPEGRGLVICVGKPMELKEKQKDLQPFADSVLDTIYSLKP